MLFRSISYSESVELAYSNIFQENECTFNMLKLHKIYCCRKLWQAIMRSSTASRWSCSLPITSQLSSIIISSICNIKTTTFASDPSISFSISSSSDTDDTEKKGMQIMSRSRAGWTSECTWSIVRRCFNSKFAGLRLRTCAPLICRLYPHAIRHCDLSATMTKLQNYFLAEPRSIAAL